jgi:hypothetical protein
MRFITAALLVAAGTLQGVVGSVVKTSDNTTVDKPTPDLGINCKGSGFCSGGGSANTLKNLICGIDSGAFFNNGQLIACDNKICAFLQGTNGGNAGTLCTLAGDIVNHGCKTCGSVPTGYPGSNGKSPDDHGHRPHANDACIDVSQGQLTFNYVASGCSGVNPTGTC